MQKVFTETHPLLGTVIVLEYRDQQHTLEARVAPEYGSNLFSLKADGNQLIYCNPSALAEREKTGTSDFTGTPILFPHPNRVRRGDVDREWAFEGKVYSLADVKTARGNHPLVHGIVRDRKFDYALFSDDGITETSVEIGPNSPYFSGFPFPCSLRLSFQIEKEGLDVTWTIENKGTENLPFGFAFHPAFLSNDETLIRIPAEFIMEADEDLLPTGVLLFTTSNDRYNLNSERPLRDVHLDDVFSGLSKLILPQIRRPDIGVSIAIQTPSDKMVLYTFEREKFVCLEPQWGATNAHNLHDQGFPAEVHGLRILKPNEEDSDHALFEIKFDK